MKTLTNTRKKYCDVWMNWRRKHRTSEESSFFGGWWGGGIISNLFDRGNEVTVSVSTTETDFHLTELTFFVYSLLAQFCA